MYIINNVNAGTLTNSQQRYRPSDNNKNVDID